MDLPWEKVKLAALDLDGTTLRPNGTLSDRTRRALESCLRHGIVIASGRAYAALPDEVLAVGGIRRAEISGEEDRGNPAGIRRAETSGEEGRRSSTGIRYAITSNGAVVNEIPSGRRLWSRCIDAADTERILETAKGKPAALETFLEGVPYAGEDYVREPEKWGCPSSSVGYIKNTRRPVPDIREFIREHKGRLDSIDFICGDMRLKSRLEEEVLACTKDIYVTSSVPHLLELSAAGGKGAGLRTVCRLTGILPEETAACGNADNDAEMLLISGIGAAVTDATPECLDAADVIIGTNREDGVAAFLEKIVKSQSL